MSAVAPTSLGAGRRVRRALDRLDLRALATGAAVGLATLLAVALVSARVEPSAGEAEDPAAVVALLLLVAVVGLAGAGATAGRRARRAPLAHGAGAAVAAVAIAAIVAVARQLVAGDPIRWWSLGGWLLLALACGTIGALVALRAPGTGAGADSPG